MIDVEQPRDVLAERAVLGECLHRAGVPETVTGLIQPADFYQPNHGMIAETLWDMAAKGVPADAASVVAECRKRNRLVDAGYVVGLLTDAVPFIEHGARRIRETAARRRLMVLATRALQEASSPSSDVYDTAAAFAVTAGDLASAADPTQAEPLTDVLDFVTGPTDFDWLVPGLLERGDRLMITGEEGSGKSWFIRQIGVSVAAGIHPFTGRNIPPLRVLQVDLENPTRHLRRGTRRLIEFAETQKRPVGRGFMFIESVPAGCDLTTSLDEQWLRRMAEQAQPDLIVIGPLYRMHAADMGKEEPARHLTAVLDSLRARHGCSLIIETHAGHGTGQGARDLRPVGSSLFRRWPEFGYGIRADTKDDTLYWLSSWRGSRDERDWPVALRRGNDWQWPWLAASPRDDDLKAHLAAQWEAEAAS